MAHLKNFLKEFLCFVFARIYFVTSPRLYFLLSRQQPKTTNYDLTNQIRKIFTKNFLWFLLKSV